MPWRPSSTVEVGQEPAGHRTHDDQTGQSVDDLRRRLSGSTDQPRLHIEREFAFPTEAAWGALTDPARLSRWFGTFMGPVPMPLGDSVEVDLGGGADDLGRHG